MICRASLCVSSLLILPDLARIHGARALVGLERNLALPCRLAVLKRFLGDLARELAPELAIGLRRGRRRRHDAGVAQVGRDRAIRLLLGVARRLTLAHEADLLAQQAPEHDHAAVGGAEVLQGVDRNWALAHLRFVVAGLFLLLLVGPVAALAEALKHCLAMRLLLGQQALVVEDAGV